MKGIYRKNEEAVSPVIGVMLMIVVTIIIAAVVSGFAGGMTSSESKVPNAAFTVHPNLNGNGTIAFHQTGGNELMLDEILVQLEYDDKSIILSNLDNMTGHANFNYLTEMGGDADGFITGGDRLVLTCDENDASDNVFVFEPASAAANFTIPYYGHIDYMILDKESAKAIQMGEFVLR
ncbi:type IV pilin N-terminal domain-containing protein [Methanogenium cariaci]|jgi:archaeal type IV pilus assembly protein PilA|uniref:type IV pilin N-terminal domain-containing protein n=1 Tax=Methanogenium cariaci TaxID=2197 RepID=UPI000786329C|nr:type IV pilin N-terminal domain-containing protein [Methanogenium cariaci]